MALTENRWNPLERRCRSFFQDPSGWIQRTISEPPMKAGQSVSPVIKKDQDARVWRATRAGSLLSGIAFLMSFLVGQRQSAILARALAVEPEFDYLWWAHQCFWTSQCVRRLNLLEELQQKRPTVFSYYPRLIDYSHDCNSMKSPCCVKEGCCCVYERKQKCFISHGLQNMSIPAQR